MHRALGVQSLTKRGRCRLSPKRCRLSLGALQIVTKALQIVTISGLKNGKRCRLSLIRVFHW